MESVTGFPMLLWVLMEDCNLWSLTDMPRSAFLGIVVCSSAVPAATSALPGTAEEAMDNA